MNQPLQRFATASDDGSRMWIDSNLNGQFESSERLDNGFGQGQGTTLGPRTAGITAGSYPIRIQYYELGGGNDFELASSPWSPRPFTPTAGNPVKVIRAIALNYNPHVPSQRSKRVNEVFGWADPCRLATQFGRDLEFVTGGAIDVQIVETRDLEEFPDLTDGYRYTPDQYVTNWQTQSGWHNSPTDFSRLIDEQGLIPLVNAGQVDEIWCFGPPGIDLFGEAWMAGPNSYFINGPTYPDIGFDRAIAGYGFNYERSEAEMIHNMGHRMENVGQRAFGSWNLAAPATAFDQFSSNYLDSVAGPYGVGTCHVPANADAHYDYNDPRSVLSKAADFVNYPNLTGATTTVSPGTWSFGPFGDTQRDYLNWYFGMMPRNAGTAPDGRVANWFKYLWDFNSYEDGTGLPRNEDAFGSGTTIRAAGATAYDFTVRYYDATGINAATLGNNDVQVTGPGGFAQNATLVSAGTQETTTGGTARTVTYRITPPGGTWDLGDGGTYQIVIRVGGVTDTLGNAIPAGEVGHFQSLIDDPRALNISSMLANGQATVSSTTLDIGPIDNLFDGNPSSLVRTANINPGVVTLAFNTAQTLYGFRASSANTLQWKIATADTLADLNSAIGTYRLVVPFTTMQSGQYPLVNLATPVTAKFARLTMQKTSGDNYVHMNEWQLLGPALTDSAPPLATLSAAPAVSTPGGTSYFASVTFTDGTALDVGSIDTGDVTISGPNGFSVTPWFHHVDNYVDGSPRIGTYWFIPPGGKWDSADNGVYTLTLQPHTVRDVYGNLNAGPVTLGSFTVNVPAPVRRPAADLTEQNAPLWSAWAEGGTASTFDDATRKILGQSSIRFETDGGFDTYLRFPPPENADWDLSLASNLYFSVYAENTNSPQFQSGSPWIRLTDLAGNSYQYQYFQNGGAADVLNEALNNWRSYVIPLNAGATVQNGWRRTLLSLNAPDLTHIASIEFHADTWGAGFKLWLDRVGFDLPVRVTSSFSATGMAPVLQMVFDVDVGSTLTKSDVQLLNLTTNQTIPLANFTLSYVASTRTATINFVGFSNNAPPDGNYRLTLPAGSVADSAGNLLASPFVDAFYVLAGDMNRDRIVNFDDLLILAQNYGQAGKTFSQGNIDYSADGRVNFDDLLLLAQRYGTSLPAPALRGKSLKSRATSLDILS